MWITNNIAARTLIWLAVVTTAVQGLPAASCGCASGKSCCQKDEQSQNCCSAPSDAATQHSCCQQRSSGPCRRTGAKICRCKDTSPCRAKARTCCGGKTATKTCCSSCDTAGKPVCQCGTNCRCSVNNEPVEPATPLPVENNSAEKVASDSVSTVSLATVYQAPSAPRTRDASHLTDALAALDRCATLCRFTL